MTKQDRPTLKSFFRSGALPTAEDYRDLIDSTVNLVEDGFSKTDTDGLRLHSVGVSRRVLSLYQGLGTPKPSWFIEHGNEEGALHFRPDLGKRALEIEAKAKAKKKEDDTEETDGAKGDGAAQKAAPAKAATATNPKANPDRKPADKDDETLAAGLCLTHDGRVGVNEDNPQWLLDVGGVARMRGRIGRPSETIEFIAADGNWHPITESLTGCQMLEIVAGAGGEEKDGRYTMLHAIAMNAFNPRNRLLNFIFRRRAIRKQTAMYGSYADRIRLKWVADKKEHHYHLEMCTNAKLGDGKVIRYYITHLWLDKMMTGSRTEGEPTKDVL